MARLPILDELPADVVRTDTPRAFAAVRGEVQEQLRAAGYHALGDPPLAISDLAGRRPLREFTAGGKRYLMRRFTHGGLLRWLTGERFFDPARPFREMLLQEHLDSIGVPTPRVAAARSRRRWHRFWNLDVVTERLEDTLDLGYVLGQARAGQIDPALRGRLVQAVGALVRQLHDGRFVHADLQPNNLLVPRRVLEGGPIEILVLDLDQSRIVPRLEDSERVENLGRLLRHIDRRRREEGPALSRTDLVRFWRGYDPEGRTWRADQAALGTTQSWARGLHALGWFLERRVGRGTDPRAQAASTLRS